MFFDEPAQHNVLLLLCACTHPCSDLKPQRAEVRRRNRCFCHCIVRTSCRQHPSVPFLLTIANRSPSEDRLCRQESQHRKIAVQLQPRFVKGVSRMQTFQHCASGNLRPSKQYTKAVRPSGLNSEPMLEALRVMMFCQTPVKTLLQAHRAQMTGSKLVAL